MLYKHGFVCSRVYVVHVSFLNDLRTSLTVPKLGIVEG